MPDYRFNRPIKRSDPERRTFRGVVYHSITERVRAQELQLLLEAGEIVAWFRQVPVSLGLDAVVRVDFLVIGVDCVWIEEVKGFDSKDFRRELRLWREHGPLPLRVLWPDKKLPGGWRVDMLDAGSISGVNEQVAETADGD